MISQVLAMDLQTSGTGSSGGAIALSIILLIVILFFLIRWSLKNILLIKEITDIQLPHFYEIISITIEVKVISNYME